MILLLISLLVAFSFVTCAPPPVPLYESYGPNQLFNDEGQAIKTVAGKDALYGVSAEKCAQICNWMDRQCTCCNAFSFKPSSGTCYLKKRSDSASDARSYSANGWQSYKYWGLVSSYPGGEYTGGLPDTVYAYSIGGPVGFNYRWSFVSKGPNQIAAYEGESIKTSWGYDSYNNNSPKECAEDCLKISECDGFSYNPNKDGGTCFMKKNSSSGKYSTVYSSQGWTFYWLDDYVEKCYCTCASTFICVTCKQDRTCDDL
eukprot:TRINITY_DN2256_c0_g1_i1.p1 TRINITY_DN2256_c0_g1~~TRINITY_DN2256_c0_g1_i1.p1  ORF type:complete len:258 (+),score=11.62 TRINITY_DN2256_c0_g1_i1:191-964(+)